MLTQIELERRIELVRIQRDKLKKESTRLRVTESRYKKLLQAYKEMKEFCED